MNNSFVRYAICVLLVLMALIAASCGSGGSGSSSSGSSSTSSSGSTTGWHNQGRDCLYCHNTDLESDKHLVIGGTVFKTMTVSDVDNVTDACNTTVYVQFLDPALNVAYDSSSYSSSEGEHGTGNIFILSRKLASLTGEYTIRLITSDGTVIAQSRNRHSFTTGSYDSSNPTDIFNRYSCNACHTAEPQNKAEGYLYPNRDASKCN